MCNLMCSYTIEKPLNESEKPYIYIPVVDHCFRLKLEYVILQFMHFNIKE